MAFPGFESVKHGTFKGIVNTLRQWVTWDGTTATITTPVSVTGALAATGDISTASGDVSGATITVTSDPGGTPAANTLYKANIPKAWINFNGTGTVATRDSFNVSGLADNGGSGDYTVTWDTDFANANYAAAGMVGNAGSAGGVYVTCQPAAPLVGSLRVDTRNTAGTLADTSYVLIAAFGDQ